MTRSVSIVIPAFNEEKRLPATLARVNEYLRAEAWNFAEVLVVDDGSSDGTAALAECDGARVLRQPANRGKGAAVRRGMLEARGEWALLTDADLSTPIEEIENLWRAAESSGAAVTIGSRALNRALIGVHQPLARETMGRAFNLVMRAVTGLRFRDTQCGFKLFRADAAREIFRRQRLDGFGFDVEALVIARELGYAAVEIPVRWNDVRGTKVSLLGGFNAFLDLARVRWNQWRGCYRRS